MHLMHKDTFGYVKKQASILQFRADIDSTTINKDTKTFEVVFATETPVFRSPWWSDESFYEVLACDKKSIRSQRLDAGVVPLLDNHSSYSVTNQFGIQQSWSIKNSECRAVIKYSSQAGKADMWNDIEDGIIKSISCGYRVWQYDRIPNNDPKKTPVYRAVDWEPMEISLAPVPADYMSSVRSEDKNTNEVEITNYTKRTEMADTQAAPVVEGAPKETAPETRSAEQQPVTAAPAVNEKEISKRAVENERQRGLQIREAVRKAKLDETFADTLVSGEKTIDEARAAILDKMAEKDVNINNTPAPSARGDEGKNTLRAMEEALMQRAQPGSVNIFNNLNAETKGKGMDVRSHDFKHMSMLDMARHCLRMKGESNPDRLSPMEVVKRALDTTDFPDLLVNNTIRFLRMYYEPIVPEWKMFSREVPANDFRVRTGIKWDAAVTFEELSEEGEYKESNLMSDENATLQLKTYARQFGISRKAIINDDLGVLTTLPRSIGIGAAQFQSRKVWGLITGNVNSPDGNAMFSTAHKNIATSGNIAAISDTSLSVARTAMRRQKSPQGNELLVLPKYLIVPPEQQTTAEKQIRPISATQTSNVNIWGDLVPVTNPYLTNATAWYLAADQGATTVDGLVHAYLSGQEGLFTESYIDKKTDKVIIKARLDFDAQSWGWQGWYLNPGA